MEKEMVCIVCPMSCHLNVTLSETGEVLSVCGNSCKRGAEYARKECQNPVRMLTSTVVLKKGIYPRLPVVTSAEIPKDMIFSVMKEINKAEVCAPIKINDIILENVCGLGIHIIAGRSADKYEQT